MKEKTNYPSVDKTHLQGISNFKLHPFIPNMSVYNSIKLMNIPYMNNIAIDCLDLSLNYKELIKNSNVIAKSLIELGVKPGEIITVCMSNYAQAVEIFLAANKIGVTVSFINSFAKKEETIKYLNYFESPIFVNYNKDEDYNREIKGKTKVRNIITLDKNDLNRKDFNKINGNLIGYNDLVTFSDLGLVSDFQKGYFKTNFNGNQDALILFTSGTTGEPKSVLITNKNILASGIYTKNTCEIKPTADESCLVCVPFCYPYGFATSVLMSLLCGRTAILAPDLSKDNIEYFMKKNPNIIFGSPALLELIKRNVSDGVDLSSCKDFITGGDFLFPKNREEGIEFFKKHNSNIGIYEGSGNAEGLGTLTSSYVKNPKPGTVGKLLVGSDAIIIDENGKELKYNEEGELCVTGDHIFKGYFKNEEQTKKAKFMYKGKEYFKTGTLGLLDEDGFFTLTGRASRYYIISTLNKVYCDKVQSIISLIDVVENACFVGKTDDDMLFTGKAFIVLKPNVPKTEETKNYIIDKCEKEFVNQKGERVQLEPYEIPTSITFLDDLPRKESSDKIDYKLLNELAEEEYKLEKLERTRK